MHFEDRRNPFHITTKELQKLMELRGQDALVGLTYYGGVNEICRKLNTSPLSGIKGTDLRIRREVFGSNILPIKPSKTIWQLMWEALQDTTLIILELAALISLGLSFYYSKNDPDMIFAEDSHEWIEGLTICLTVLVVVVVTAANDYTKERQFRSLQNRVQSERKFFIIRSGETVSAPINDLVVGDICLIKYGDVIPADGIIIQSNDLNIDESSVTGESDYVRKGLSVDPMILSGTRVMEGTGKIVITAVGVCSQAGMMYTLLGTVSLAGDMPNIREETYPTKTTSQNESVTVEFSEFSEKREVSRSILQAKLAKLAVRIGYIGTVIAILTIIILILQFTIEMFVVEKNSWHNHYLNNYVNHFILGVTILVVAVPEGLPLAVTLSLAFSVKKMMKDNNLVRHLDACETMGNATSICSDKTGTLTMNRMAVVQSYICEVWSSETPQFSSLPENVGNLIVFGISVNTVYTSQIVASLEPGGIPEQVGNKTECALLGFVQSLGKSYQQIRGYYPESLFVRVYTFNSVRKSMSTVVRHKGTGFRLYTKGASEVMLNKCAFIYGLSGNVIQLTPEIKKKLISDVIDPMASEGLRTILMAHRDFVPGEADSNEVSFKLASGLPWDDEDFIINDLTAICIVGIEDPVRPEVPSAIKACQDAGITVRMVTGDNIYTACSIALKCGIIRSNDDSLVLEGKDFNRLIRDSHDNIHQSKIDKLLPKLRVMARSSPQDKYNLVKGIIESKLSEHREVVAVTGDGTNDGPALKKADVGFAMGIAGTDVAKEASDIILTDDNFSSIVKAVIWGRNVYDNISKFLQFQLTVNLVAVTVVFFGSITVQESPLKAVQMLWVNLIMDTLASLALAAEPPSKELLQRKPYGRTKSLISRTMLMNIVGQAFYQLIVLFFLLFYGDTLFDVPSGRGIEREGNCSSTHFTIVFNVFVFMTLFNEINVRKIHKQRNIFDGLCRNRIFVIIWIGTLVVQILIVEYGGQALCVKDLDLDEWFWCVFIGMTTLIWGQIIISLREKLLFYCHKEAIQSERMTEETIEREHSYRNRINQDFR